MKQREKWSMSQVLSAQDPVWDLNGVTIDKTCHDGAGVGAGVSVVPVPGAGNTVTDTLCCFGNVKLYFLLKIYIFFRKV